MNTSNQTALDRNAWEAILDQIGMSVTGELCLIGSSACIFSNMPGRTSMDLDVWRPSSTFQPAQLKKAVEAAGLLFNPTEEYINQPYIQLVDPGIVQLGDFSTTTTIAKYGKLVISRPPIENIIAAKLLRAEIKDIEDIAHLIQAHAPSRKLIESVISSMPSPQRGKARENLVFLEVLLPRKNL
jgi:hypothetical protein